jgi:hypothetical protein
VILRGAENVKTGSAKPDRRRRWIWWVFLVVIILALVVLTPGQARAVYYGGRRAQNAADFAVLSGLRALGFEFQQPAPREEQVLADMMRATTLERDLESLDLVGCYLDAAGTRLGAVGEGIPEGAHGLQVISLTRVPTLLTRLLGLEGWPVERQAEFYFRPE